MAIENKSQNKTAQIHFSTPYILEGRNVLAVGDPQRRGRPALSAPPKHLNKPHQNCTVSAPFHDSRFTLPARNRNTQ